MAGRNGEQQRRLRLPKSLLSLCLSFSLVRTYVEDGKIPLNWRPGEKNWFSELSRGRLGWERTRNGLVVAPGAISVICNAAWENHWPRLCATICQREIDEGKRDRNEEGQYLLGKLLIEELGISKIKQQIKNAPREWTGWIFSRLQCRVKYR